MGEFSRKKKKPHSRGLKHLLLPVRILMVLLPSSLFSWFDIKNFSRVADPSLDDEERMLDAVQVVEYLIKVEVEQMGIPEERIVVAGISQGGVITLLTGLTTKRKLAGLLCLSGWIPLGHKIKSVSIFSE